MKISINTHSSIRLESDKVFYFDPFRIEEKKQDADYIFITHDHWDHFDIKSINNIIKSNTIIIAPVYLENKIKKLTNNYLLVEANHTYKIEEISFDTVISYNINKEFHKKEYGNVGYNVFIDGMYYFIPGDTDNTEEMNKVKTDICFVPIGGTYTMDYKEASDFINHIKPKKVIPIHYGSVVGDISLKDKFSDLINKDIEIDSFIK